MLPTPSTPHLAHYNTIYEPAEDSFLLLDTLSAPTEIAWLHSRFSSHTHSPTPLVVEVGTGSGVVIAFLTAHARRIFGSRVVSVGVDVNADACRATGETVERALREGAMGGEAAEGGCEGRGKDDGEGADERDGEEKEKGRQGPAVYLGGVCGDLTTSIRPGTVDVLVFNPPYVPTESVPELPTPLLPPPPPLPQSPPHPASAAPSSRAAKEAHFTRSSHLLSLSYAGGAKGREVTDRFLAQVPAILSERGVCYVLLCQANGVEEVRGVVGDWQKGKGKREGMWRTEIVGRSGRTAGWERLEVLRIWKGKDR